MKSHIQIGKYSYGIDDSNVVWDTEAWTRSNVKIRPKLIVGKSGVYYVPNTTYYNQTKNYIPYSTLQACLTAGEKISKK